MTTDNPELEPVAVEIPEAPELEAGLENAEELTETPEDSGEEEVEYEGNKYRVPKELKDALLRQADYTRKTQEVAELRRTHEQQAQTFEQERQQAVAQLQRQQQNLQGYAQLAALDAQLQQYQGVDWNSLTENDPVQAQKLFFQQSQLREQRGQIAAYLSQAEQQATLMTQQEIAKRIEQGREVLAKEIPGWSAETAKSVAEYGMASFGFSRDEMAQVIDPRHVKVLHKAYLYDQLMHKAQAKPKPETEPQPTRKVSAGQASTKDPDKMTTEEWVKWRQKQIRQAR